MAIDMLDEGLNDRIPQLYRHDMEFLVWVLSYITVAKIEYKNHAIEISPLSEVEAWFKDDDQRIAKNHFANLHYHYVPQQPPTLTLPLETCYPGCPPKFTPCASAFSAVLGRFQPNQEIHSRRPRSQPDGE